MQDPKTILLDTAIDQSWSKISILWPMANSIAINPLHGLEDLPFEKAIDEGSIYFQQTDFPREIDVINRQTIKWMQAFFDTNQATIVMPLRVKGLYHSLRVLIKFDQEIIAGNIDNQRWLESLSYDPAVVIKDVLHSLNIPESNYGDFLTLVLTTLPGWASYVKYVARWSGDSRYNRSIEIEYLAIRLVFMHALWPQAASILEWYASKKMLTYNSSFYQNMVILEEKHQKALQKKLKKEILSLDSDVSDTNVQMVFCIDVRSEPFRRNLEYFGGYETLGFAGFFGLPLRIDSQVSCESYNSCPVLVPVKDTVQEISCNSDSVALLITIQRLYQSMKYAFAVPFVLVEILGIFFGLAMAVKTFIPYFLNYIQKKWANVYGDPTKSCLDIGPISIDDQVEYAENVLNILGLNNKNLKKIVIFCGHGSASTNNPYAASLDCGACGGRHGGNNARILAMILNSLDVRQKLLGKGICIPSETVFIGAEHNTTTDEVVLYDSDVLGFTYWDDLDQIKINLELARTKNSLFRSRLLGFVGKDADSVQYVQERSQDWAQIRPEWGLAGNASFIIAPRNLTKNIDLGGRSFLHSYDYSKDLDGSFLNGILTAPMVVAQWINCQYLFSTVDNVAYGSGSKITQNIVGKFGIMQGNASDLMMGLPLQSLYISHDKAYHEPIRLQVFVHAHRVIINKLILSSDVLQKLFGNGWVILICIEPVENTFYVLNRDFSWSKSDD